MDTTAAAVTLGKVFEKKTTGGLLEWALNSPVIFWAVVIVVGLWVLGFMLQVLEGWNR